MTVPNMMVSRFVVLMVVCQALFACSIGRSDLDVYFSNIINGHSGGVFPYKEKRIEFVCVLQAYQNRVKSKKNVNFVELINVELERVGFVGSEGKWQLVILSDGRIFVDAVDRYVAPLHSPLDGNQGEWRSDVGKNSEECVSGGNVKFVVFVNERTEERRVGIVSN
ncbi:hypothetical protein E6C76_08245 [Pseudothauera nasutitermitis]|uniref:Uncharacterized protein n=1 Tax=Pseudothauera nasutitermitis TaxID=2565930 RepID=A0A4S4AZE7_9RHOO|nr:hypothetical protein [Pseudothauera nasutitermitis]THF65560.1 hypothetical protein E6C76_08245 [Pseudothauera nasutitermitis]